MPYNSNKPANDSYIRRVLLGDKSQKDTVNVLMNNKKKIESKE